MRTLKIDEYLVVNTYTGKRRWLSKIPSRLGAYDVPIRIKATIKIPDMLPVLELGEIAIPDLEAEAQAVMQ